MSKFVLLNLSDLHIMAEEPCQIDILNNLKKELTLFLYEHINWTPDYIIMPGDVVNRSKVENYKVAAEYLNEISSVLINKQPNSFHVILAPGNHDKNISKETAADRATNEITKNEKVKELNRKAKRHYEVITSLEACSDSEEKREKFITYQIPAFENFNTFYRQFCECPCGNNKIKYIPCPCFKGRGLEYTMGLKVFEENKVCFLSLNTEWLYAPGDVWHAVKKKHKEVFEEYQIGRSFLTSLIEEIKREYADYTVITLMHRPPEALSWDERNHTDLQKEFGINELLNWSDIIFSGHEHAVETASPDMLQNKVQRFKLGTQGGVPNGGFGKGNTFPYSASLLEVNSVTEKMTLLKISFVGDHWKFDGTNQEFSLRNKFHKGKFRNGESHAQNDIHLIKVKNDDEREIEGRIHRYFLYDNPVPKIIDIDQIDEFKKVVNGKRKDFDSIKKINCIETGQPTGELSSRHFVFYKKYIYRVDSEVEDAWKKFERMQEIYKKKILTMEFIFSFVFIQKPMKHDFPESH